jgi:hypothetical protein
MKRKIIFSLIFLSFLFLLFLNESYSKYIPTKKSQKTLQHEVAVTLKLVQIYVIDMEGNPVTDLEISDFILYDNGKLKTITEFERHLLSLPWEKEEGVKSLEDKQLAGKNADKNRKPPRISRKFLLFFDFAFMRKGTIPLAKKLALYFIDTQIHPDDEVGVITYDTFKGFSLHEYFTTEHQKVREVVESFGIKEAMGRA